MQNLSGFFDKFQGKVSAQIQNIVVIIEIVKKHTGIEIEMKDINISAGVLRLKISSVEKSQVFLKKERILREINEKVKGMVLKEVG